MRSGWQLGQTTSDCEGLAWDGASALAMATEAGSITDRAIWRVHITKCMLDMRAFLCHDFSTLRHTFRDLKLARRPYISEAEQ